MKINKNGFYMVNITEDNTFFILNKERKIVQREEILSAVQREINNLEIRHEQGLFYFTYKMQEGTGDDNCPKHDYKTVSHFSEVQKRHKVWPIRTLYFRIAESRYECLLCGRIYIARVILEL